MVRRLSTRRSTAGLAGAKAILPRVQQIAQHVPAQLTLSAPEAHDSLLILAGCCLQRAAQQNELVQGGDRHRPAMHFCLTLSELKVQACELVHA